MLPQRVIYGGKLYDTLGLIKMNVGSFIIIKNDENVLSLDLDKTQLNLDLKFNVKQATRAEQVLMDFIMPVIINEVKSGKELYLIRDNVKDINKYINTHPTLLKNIDELKDKNEVINKNMLGLLEYFNNEFNKEVGLDFSNVTSFRVEGNDYIKANDGKGNVRILEDNVVNRDFVSQVESKQFESKLFQTDNDLTNTNNIIDQMANYEKETVELENVSEIKEENLNEEENISNEAILDHASNISDDIVGNPSKGIYYNKTDDQILTVSHNEENILINEVNQTSLNNIETKLNSEKQNNDLNNSSSINYPDYNSQIITEFLVSMKNNPSFELDAFINKYLYDFSLEQVDYLLNNYNLNLEQREKLIQKKQNTQKENIVDTNVNKKEKTLILTKKDDKKAAFIDTLMLALIVCSICGTYLTYFIFGIMS